MSTEAGRSPQKLHVACKLTDEQQSERREELAREVFSGCQATNELDDGYEFVFPGDERRAEKLVGFVISERECCPFFTFEMIFEPKGGPISLRIRGPEGSKELLGDNLPGYGAG